jgi:alkaline phosphatase D
LLLPGQSWAQGTPAPLTRIAFGSCADEEKPQPIWDAVMTHRLELFLFLGDNVYGDLRNGRNMPDEELIDRLQESYIQASKLPGFMRTRTEVPSMATWDDYGYGKNDARVDFTGRRRLNGFSSSSGMCSCRTRATAAMASIMPKPLCLRCGGCR